MPKIDEWSGTEHSEIYLPNDTNRNLNEFCSAHKSVYIYGAGKIGTGFKNYLEQCDVPLVGFVTSDMLDDFRHIYKRGETGFVMGLSDKNLAEVMLLVQEFVPESDIFIAPSEYRERIGQFTVDYVRNNLGLCIYLVSHCNLNCKACKPFSAVARKDFYDYDDFVNDMKQLANMDLPVKYFNLTGGEPYLHPDLFKIFRMSRELYPDALFKCYTNGSLLKRLSDRQLKELIELDIITVITVYPPFADAVDAFCHVADDMGVKYSIIRDECKMFLSQKLNISGSAPKYVFYDCYYGHSCRSVSMYKGKIYRCGRPMYIPYFNEYFGTDFKVREGDYLDIYDTTPEEIFKFKITRTPFCDYHNSEDYSLVEWGLSERKIEEWVHLEQFD